jgi:hypothetical protein
MTRMSRATCAQLPSSQARTTFSRPDQSAISERAVGTRRVYRLNPTAVAALRDQLDAFWQRALASYTDVAEQATEESP